MRKLNPFRKSTKGTFAILALVSMLALVLPGAALADQPVREEYFICPSVSTHNPNGMWVMGTHGAYYVIVPNKGGPNAGKVFLTVPVTVPDLAQVRAGWGLYKDLPTYPNFEGNVVLLGEGIDTWLDGGLAGWVEGDMATVEKIGDVTYLVTNHGPMMDPVEKGAVTIDNPIPLASAAVW